jgi:hypothetical protein
MKEIKLSKGFFAIVDDRDFERLSQYGWWFGPGGYATRQTYQGRKDKKSLWKNVFMHHEILKAPKGMFIDHINRNRLDNRIINLRIASYSQNGANKIVKNPTGYRGVQYLSKPNVWVAKITVNNKQYYLGRFKDPILAAKAYDMKAKELFGEFAVLNLN